MRGRVCLISAGLLLSGCGGETVANLPAPSVSVTELPASAAGGLCRLLDFGVIEEITGTRFDVSAARTYKKTQTCVVQATGESRPDLSLSVTVTSADKAVFTAEMVPRGAKSVKGLGKAAYQLIVAPGKEHGAAVEIGWLGDKQLYRLRYTLAGGQEKAVAQELAPTLIELAKELDAAKQP